MHKKQVFIIFCRKPMKKFSKMSKIEFKLIAILSLVFNIKIIQ